MAFNKAIILKGDVNIPDAYHKIAAFDINPIDKILKIEIAIYKDEATKTASEQNYIQGYSKNISITNWVDESNPENPIIHNDFNDFFTQSISAGTLKSGILTALYTWLKNNNDYYSDATEV